MGLAVTSAAPISLTAAKLAFQIGLCAGSNDFAPCGDLRFAMHPAAAFVVVAAGLASGLVWAAFSKRQDEMFNRIQNWALGVAGAWTCAATLVWSMLSWGGILPMLQLWAAALLFVHLLLIFWFVAVWRWVS